MEENAHVAIQLVSVPPAAGLSVFVTVQGPGERQTHKVTDIAPDPHDGALTFAQQQLSTYIRSTCAALGVDYKRAPHRIQLIESSNRAIPMGTLVDTVHHEGIDAAINELADWFGVAVAHTNEAPNCVTKSYT